MVSNERLQRAVAVRQLGGPVPVASGTVAEPASDLVSDVKLFALTFAGGFLFTTIFLA